MLTVGREYIRIGEGVNGGESTGARGWFGVPAGRLRPGRRHRDHARSDPACAAVSAARDDPECHGPPVRAGSTFSVR